MRIGLVIPGGLDPSGVDHSIPALVWLVSRLAQRHDVEVLSLRQGPRPRHYEVHGARVHDLGLSRHRGATAAGVALVRATAWLTGRTACDVWHGLWLGLPATLAALAATIQRRPLVASVMGTEFARNRGPDARGRASARIARWSAERAAQATAGSEFQRAQAAAHGIHCAVIPLGVPREWFSAHDDTQGDDPVRLVHVGDLNPWKDQVTLLDAMVRVRERIPGAHLDIAGTDTLDGAIQRAAGARGLAGHVTFCGPIGRDDLRALIGRSALLVMSSRHESQCVAVVEAAALGVATVGTRVGLVADGDGAWTQAVPVGDAGALAGAVVALLCDRTRRRALASAARAWAEAHDADWTAATFEAVYRDVIARHGTRAPA